MLESARNRIEIDAYRFDISKTWRIAGSIVHEIGKLLLKDVKYDLPDYPDW